MTIRSFVASHTADPGTWLATASSSKIRVLAALAGVLLFVVVGLADWIMYDARFHPYGIMLGSDAVASILVSLTTLQLLRDSQRRRAMVRRYLNIIGESNHHIRNALELIQFSAQTTHDRKTIDQIAMGIDRIEWVLRELLGDGNLETDREETPRSPNVPQQGTKPVPNDS